MNDFLFCKPHVTLYANTLYRVHGPQAFGTAKHAPIEVAGKTTVLRQPLFFQLYVTNLSTDKTAKLTYPILIEYSITNTSQEVIQWPSAKTTPYHQSLALVSA